MTHFHLIGIGGSGLSAIARVLLESGNTVSGSDSQLSPLARSIQSAGAKVMVGHRPENVNGADLVIRSSAIPDDNVEVRAARAASIPVHKRIDFIGQLMSGRQGIAVAGTHGKTTTSAMIAYVLSSLDQDPSFIIGGVLKNLGTNAHAGRGNAFVIEADEYDRMFLGLNPHIAVVTNVEHDHPDCYPTSEDYFQSFQEFVKTLIPGGVLLVCGDDPGAVRLKRADEVHHRQLSYGLEESHDGLYHDYSGLKTSLNRHGGFDFDVYRGASSLGQVSLKVPGKHNVLNALAAFAVADLLNLPGSGISRALGEYRGTDRRFEVLGTANDIIVIDDYAHHPTEIRATLAAARTCYPGRDIWAVFQPHTYSRTLTLFDDYVNAFADADHVLVTEIYAAREPAVDGFSARQIVAAMIHPDVHFVPDLPRATTFLLGRLKSGDVLLVLSAGDADQISVQVLKAL